MTKPIKFDDKDRHHVLSYANSLRDLADQDYISARMNNRHDLKQPYL